MAGITKSDEINKQIEEEKNIYNDIIQENFYDSYRNR